MNGRTGTRRGMAQSLGFKRLLKTSWGVLPEPFRGIPSREEKQSLLLQKAVQEMSFWGWKFTLQKNRQSAMRVNLSEMRGKTSLWGVAIGSNLKSSQKMDGAAVIV